MPERAGVAVFLTHAVRLHFDRIGAQPPVDQIEVMARLVDPQRAALRLQPVPAAEVVGAVADVEIPVEVDRADRAELVRREDLLDLDVLRREPIVEADGDLALVALLGFEDRLALLLVDHHRLFGDDVDAAVERADDVFAVEGVDGGNRQEIRLHRVDHLVEVGEGRTVDAEALLRDLDALRVDVAEADELEHVRIAFLQVAAPHAEAADARADDRVALLRAAPPACPARSIGSAEERESAAAAPPADFMNSRRVDAMSIPP